MGAWTTTTPSGAVKQENKKDIEKIMLAHGIPYVATASVAYPDDMIKKFKKARTIKGTKFIHLLSPCPPGWRIDPAMSIRITRMATQAKVFPIYEVENGTYKINVYPEKETPLKEYLGTQGRFRQIPEDMITVAQERADRNWEDLLRMSGEA